MLVKRLLVSLLCVLLLTTAAASSGSRDCLSYGPAGVKLAGRIRVRTFPGPPNYESVKKGDTPEEAWVLHLARPVCVKAGKENEFDVAERNVTDVQMALEPKQYKVWRKLARGAGPVVVTGTLFHSHTGHHHTDVLVDVSDIARQR